MKTHPQNGSGLMSAAQFFRTGSRPLKSLRRSIVKTVLLAMAIMGGVFKSDAQTTLTLTFEGAFERYYGSFTSTVNSDAWIAFRASLLGSYTYSGFRMSGSANPTGISCTDPAVAAAVAAALRTGGSYVGSSDGQTWRVGICTVTGTDCVELTNTSALCFCDPGYTVRPEISNGNWGGIDGATCDGLSQTMKVEFFYASCSTPSAIAGNTPVCAGSTRSLSSATSGGTWSSGSLGIATVNASGVVSGVAAGTSLISYTVSGGCATTTVVTVNAKPSVGAAGQANVLCFGGATGSAMVSASGGGGGYGYSWAPAGGGSATASGLSAGGYTCTVTDVNGCTNSRSFTITQPPALAGGTVVTNVSCNSGSNGTINLTASGGTPGYTYNWGGGVTTEDRTGLAAGGYTCTITDANSCTRTVTATVTQPSSPVGGSASATSVSCFGGSNGTINLTPGGGSPGYTFNWSGGVTTEDRTGLAAGSYTCTITDANGCVGTVTSTVTQPSAPVGGTTVVTNVSCNGGSNGAINLTPGGGTPGYTYNWGGGVMTEDRTGLAAGAYTCTITDANGCSGSATATVTQPPTLTSSVAAQTNVACFGASTGAVTVSASGGVGGYTYAWSPGGGTAATKSGLSAGGYTCTVTDANGCIAITTGTITQPSTPVSAGSVSGGGAYCVGNSISFSASGSGGTPGYTYYWSGPAAYSATGATPSIGSGTTGNSGTYTVTVTDNNGCTATGTTAVTVNSNPGASTGETFTCVGGGITLSNATGAGTWSSSNTAIATAGSSTGVVTGVAAGSVGITYTLGTGCFSVKTIDVNPAMASITGTTNVCIGTTTDLDHSFTGGTWSTAVPYYASVDASTGVVTGAHVGSTPVTYMVNSGCVATSGIYIPNIVLNISGGLSACEGGGSSISVPGYPGGTWISDDEAIATINGVTGIMSGISTGTVEITYQYAYCFTTAVATVNAVPASITGGSSVCAGSTIALACSTGGGVWSSGNTARATVDGSGTVTGAGAGTVTIYYTLGTGCASTKVLTVGAMPSAITGTTTVCADATTSLTCATTGGTWSSSATGIADVISTSGTSVVITGVAAGAATISYNHSGGCVQTVNVTVTSPPSAIGGALDICVGGTSILTGSVGGTWSSSNTAVASIGSASGMAMGLSAGTANITYRTGSTCYTTSEVTVSVPSAISGEMSVCKTYTTTFTHAIGGGTWASSNSSVASVDASGVVTGVNAGNAYITYHIGTGCYTVKNVFVYNNPNPLTGSSTLCAGAFTVLTSTSGGSSTWSTGDAGVATVVTGGTVTGVSAGVADITYTANATGCYVTKSMTVNEMPATITGGSDICVDATGAYTSSPSGGTWTSSSTARATIDATTGMATGVTPGGTTIRYTLSTGCQVTKPVTVTALPGGITGTMVVCVGNSVVLSAATSGSTWSTSASGTASITATTATTATISGISGGTADISYANAAGCSRISTVTVNAAVEAIEGDDFVCSGGAATLTNATGGGTWSSSSYPKVSIGTYTGIAGGGATVGTATITYKVGAGCYTTKTMTNNAALPNISGVTYTCSGEAGAVTFTNGVSGGTWTSSNTSVAVVDASTGVVTGVLLGGSNTYVNIIYATSAGCMKSKSILIKPQPVITGESEVAVDATATITGSPSGGAWASSSSATAYISGYGIVTGMSAGTATISYTYAGCVNTKDIFVTGGEPAPRPAGMTKEAVTLFGVFPNPSHGSLSVKVALAGIFAIYTVDGKQVSVSEVVEGTNAITMPQGLAAGTYLCRFAGTDGSVHIVRLVYEP